MRRPDQSSNHMRAARLGLLVGVSALFAAHPALAQQAAPAAPEAAPETAPAADDIVVTASRLTRDGYTAPTPTTVLSQDFLKQRAVADIGEALNKIPSLRAAVSPSAGGARQYRRLPGRPARPRSDAHPGPARPRAPAADDDPRRDRIGRHYRPQRHSHRAAAQQ